MKKNIRFFYTFFFFSNILIFGSSLYFINLNSNNLLSKKKENSNSLTVAQAKEPNSNAATTVTTQEQIDSQNSNLNHSEIIQQNEIKKFLITWINYDVGKIWEILNETFEQETIIEGITTNTKNQIKFNKKFPSNGVKIVHTTVKDKTNKKYIAYDYVNLQYVGFDIKKYTIDYNDVKSAPPPGLFLNNEWPNVTGTGETATLNLDNFFPTIAVRNAVAKMLGNSTKKTYTLKEWHTALNRNALSLQLSSSLITDISEIFNPNLQWGFGVHFFNDLFSESNLKNQQYIKYAGLFEIDVSFNELTYFPEPIFDSMPALRIIKANNNEITAIGNFDTYQKTPELDEVQKKALSNQRKIGWLNKVYKILLKHKDEIPSYLEDFNNYFNTNIKSKISNKNSSLYTTSINEWDNKDYVKLFSTNPFIPFIAKETYKNAANDNLHKIAHAFIEKVNAPSLKNKFNQNLINFNDLIYPIQVSMYSLLFQNNKIDLIHPIKVEVNEVNFSYNNLRYIPPINLAPLPVNYMMYFNSIYRYLKSQNLAITMQMIDNYNFLHKSFHWKKTYKLNNEEKNYEIVTKLFAGIAKGKLFDTNTFLPKLSFSNNKLTDLLPSIGGKRYEDQWINYSKDKIDIKLKEIWPWNKTTKDEDHNAFTELNWFGKGIYIMPKQKIINKTDYTNCFSYINQLISSYFGTNIIYKWTHLTSVLEKILPKNYNFIDFVTNKTNIEESYYTEISSSNSCSNNFDFINTSTLLGNFDFASGFGQQSKINTSTWRPNFEQNINNSKDIEDEKIIFNSFHNSEEIINIQEAEFDLNYDLTKNLPFFLPTITDIWNLNLNSWSFNRAYKNNLSMYNNHTPFLLLRSLPINYFRKNEKGLVNVSLIEADNKLKTNHDLLNDKFKNLDIQKLLKIFFPEDINDLIDSNDEKFITTFFGEFPWTRRRHLNQINGIQKRFFENVISNKLILKIEYPERNWSWKYNINLIKKAKDYKFNLKNNQILNLKTFSDSTKTNPLKSLQTKQINWFILAQNLEYFIPENNLGIDAKYYIQKNKHALEIIEQNENTGTVKIKLSLIINSLNISKIIVCTIKGFKIPEISFIKNQNQNIVLTNDTEEISNFHLTTKTAAIKWIVDNMVVNHIGINLKTEIENNKNPIITKTNGSILDSNNFLKQNGFYFLNELDKIDEIINITSFDAEKGVLKWVINLKIDNTILQKQYSIESFRTWKITLDESKIESSNGIEYYKDANNINEALKITVFRKIKNVENKKSKQEIESGYLGDNSITTLVAKKLISSNDEFTSIITSEINKKLKVSISITKKSDSTNDVNFFSFISNKQFSKNERKFSWKPKISQNNNVAYFESENDKYVLKNPSEILKEIITFSTSEGLKTFFKKYLNFYKYKINSDHIKEIALNDKEIENLTFGFTKELKTSAEDIEKYVTADDFNNILNISELYIQYTETKNDDSVINEEAKEKLPKDKNKRKNRKNHKTKKVKKSFRTSEEGNKEVIPIAEPENSETKVKEILEQDVPAEEPEVSGTEPEVLGTEPEEKKVTHSEKTDTKDLLILKEESELKKSEEIKKIIKIPKIQARFNFYGSKVYTIDNKPENDTNKLWATGVYNPNLFFKNGKNKWGTLLPSEWKEKFITLSKNANFKDNKEKKESDIENLNEYQQFVGQIINTSTSNEIDQTNIYIEDPNKIKINDFIGEVTISANAFKIYNFYFPLEIYSKDKENTQTNTNDKKEKIFTFSGTTQKYEKEIKFYLSSIINKRIMKESIKFDSTKPTIQAVQDSNNNLQKKDLVVQKENNSIFKVSAKEFIINDDQTIIQNIQKELKSFNIPSIEKIIKNWNLKLNTYYSNFNIKQNSALENTQNDNNVDKKEYLNNLSAEKIIEKLIHILLKPQYSNNFPDNFLFKKNNQEPIFKFTELKVNEKNLLKGFLKLNFKVENLITHLDETTQKFKTTEIESEVIIYNIAKLKFFPDWHESKKETIGLISRRLDLQKLQKSDISNLWIKNTFNSNSLQTLTAKEFYDKLLDEKNDKNEINLAKKIENVKLISWNVYDEFGTKIFIEENFKTEIINSDITEKKIHFFTKEEYVILDENKNSIYILKTFLKNNENEFTRPEIIFDNESVWNKKENHYELANTVSITGFKSHPIIHEIIDDSLILASSNSTPIIITVPIREKIILTTKINDDDDFEKNNIGLLSKVQNNLKKPEIQKTTNSIADIERYFEIFEKNNFSPSAIFEWLIECSDEPIIISYFLHSIYEIHNSNIDTTKITLGFSKKLKEKIKKYKNIKNDKNVLNIQKQDFIFYNDLLGQIEIIDHLNNITIEDHSNSSLITQTTDLTSNETTIASLFKESKIVNKTKTRSKRSLVNQPVSQLQSSSNQNHLIINGFEKTNFNISTIDIFSSAYNNYVEYVFNDLNNNLEKAKELLIIPKYTNDPKALNISITKIEMDQINLQLFLHYSISSHNNSVQNDKKIRVIKIQFFHSLLFNFVSKWLPTILFMMIVIFFCFYYSSKKFHRKKYQFIFKKNLFVVY